MSMFENNRYHWRETYFVLFRQEDRPTIHKLEEVLGSLGDHYEVRNLHADDDDLAESLTVIAHDDCAALDICYIEGEEVVEQIEELSRELKRDLTGPEGKAIFAQITHCDARFDVLHFEEKSVLDKEENNDVEDESLDPSALLLVLDKLAKLTNGIAYDPQSGVIVEEE